MCNTFATVRLFSPFVSIQIGEFPQGNLPLYHKTGRGAILQTTSRASARGCNLNFSNSVPGAVSLPQCSLRILSLQYWPWLRVLASPRAPHLSGALEARGRGATLGRYPGERKESWSKGQPVMSYLAVRAVLWCFFSHDMPCRHLCPHYVGGRHDTCDMDDLARANIGQRQFRLVENLRTISLNKTSSH